MITRNLHRLIIGVGITLISQHISAQEIDPTWEMPTDDLGNVSDEFQENFFEGLKQKAIENYELALDALTKAKVAAKKNPKYEAVVFFEMGKNLTFLKRYDEAEEMFKVVLESEGNRLEVMEALYDLYFITKDYDSAIPLVRMLIEQDEDYKEDLANLYTRTEQFDKALELLDELDETWGESDYRDALRTQIYRQTGNSIGQIEKLTSKIDANPKNEKDFLNLIFLYSEQGDTEKAFEMAKTLLENMPESQLVHLALYKFYLEKGALKEAKKSMQVVFKSSEIDNESKYRVLEDFIQFVSMNPDYESDLASILSYFSFDNNGEIFEQLGDYYIAKGKKEEALTYYERGVALDIDNYSLVKNTLLLQIDFKKYDEAAKLSDTALEIFPSQPLLYLLSGVANIALNRVDIAIEQLELGLDYLLDDSTMEMDYYSQLAIAYTQKGALEKAEAYTKKANSLKGSN